MTLVEFSWPAELFDPAIGLSVSLESVSTCDQLWEHAAEVAGWPGGLDGRIQFHALALYSLRRGRPPGRLLTSAVRDQKFGRLLWANAGDRVAAAARLGVSSRTNQAAGPKVSTPRPAVARDWSRVDAAIEALTDEAACELLPSQFIREAFTRSLLAGKRPQASPLFRDALRRALQSAAQADQYSEPVRSAEICGGKL